MLALRAERKLGPARIGPLLGMPASTVHAVLRRHGMHRLAWLDRLIRRYERERPAELLHVDVKKLEHIRDGGGHHVHGRDSEQNRRARAQQDAGRHVGYDFVHCAVDDHSRLAYAELHPRREGHGLRRLPAARRRALPRPGLGAQSRFT